MESHDFYEHDVLDYLQAEYATAGQSLGAAVRRPPRSRRSPGYVTKKSIEKQHPFSKEFLLDFVIKNPNVLDGYRDRKSKDSKPLTNAALSASTGGEVEWTVADLTDDLSAIQPGNADAEKYEQWVKKALSRAFYPALVDPKSKQRMNDGRKVVDIMFSHRSGTSGFARLAANLQIAALRVPFECKNYSTDPKNPELDQLIARLDEKRGKIGVLVCRAVTDPATMNRRCLDTLKQGAGFVMWFEDSDIIKLLETGGDSKPAWAVFHERVDDILNADV